MIKSRQLWFAAFLGLLPMSASAQAVLPMGETSSGSAAPGSPAEFSVTLDGPGFLTVVVREEKGGEEDLLLSVTDNEYQTLPDGRSDQDLGGVMSAEQVVVRIPQAGTYVTIVELPYGDATVDFEIGGAFLSTALAAGIPDPDGRPSGALSLTVGTMHEATINPSVGDAWDWFSITAKSAGVLIVFTRANNTAEGDLKLEIFRADDFRDPFDSSDQDQSGVLTNESLNADVAAGETVYIKVSPSFGFGGGGPVAFKMGSVIVPG